MQVLDHLRELAGRGRQVEEQIAPQGFVAKAGEELLQFLIGRRVREFALAIG